MSDAQARSEVARPSTTSASTANSCRQRHRPSLRGRQPRMMDVATVRKVAAARQALTSSSAGSRTCSGGRRAAVRCGLVRCRTQAPARGLLPLLRSRPLGSPMGCFDRGYVLRDSLSPTTLRRVRGDCGRSARKLMSRSVQGLCQGRNEPFRQSRVGDHLDLPR